MADTEKSKAAKTEDPKKEKVEEKNELVSEKMILKFGVLFFASHHLVPKLCLCRKVMKSVFCDEFTRF